MACNFNRNAFKSIIKKITDTEKLETMLLNIKCHSDGFVDFKFHTTELQDYVRPELRDYYDYYVNVVLDMCY